MNFTILYSEHDILEVWKPNANLGMAQGLSGEGLYKQLHLQRAFAKMLGRHYKILSGEDRERAPQVAGSNGSTARTNMKES